MRNDKEENSGLEKQMTKTENIELITLDILRMRYPDTQQVVRVLSLQLREEIKAGKSF